LHREKVARRAGVKDVRELRDKDLESCHELADDFASLLGCPDLECAASDMQRLASLRNQVRKAVQQAWTLDRATLKTNANRGEAA